MFDNNIAKTKVGLIEGRRSDDGTCFKFMGIPYARIDKGNPFAPATPEPTFEGIFQAFDDTVMCPQVSYFPAYNVTGIGTLDSLIINVFVPSSSVSTKMAVLVYIHGGAFAFGSGYANFVHPDNLARNGIVVVSFNSRQNIYGFLCLNTKEVPGNQGLKDQVLALRWIKNNIEGFGGDPTCVTVLGESSGATAVDLLLHGNYENLFQRVILVGGGSYCLQPDLRRDDSERIIELVNHLGFKTDDRDKALDFLKQADPKLVTTAVKELFRYHVIIPCVEDEFEDVKAVLTDNTINIKTPKMKDKEILLGYTNDDAYVYLDPSRETFSALLERNFDIDEKELKFLTHTVMKFYLKDVSIYKTCKSQVKQERIKFITDFIRIHPMQRTIDKYIENGAKKVYNYVFSYVGGRNGMRDKIIKVKDPRVRSVHSDEVGYLFEEIPFAGLKKDPITREDKLIMDRMTTIWVNFTKFGDPTPKPTELLPVKWRAVSQEDRVPKCLEINTAMQMQENPFHDRMAFWDLVYKLYGERQRGYRKQETVNGGISDNELRKISISKI